MGNTDKESCMFCEQNIYLSGKTWHNFTDNTPYGILKLIPRYIYKTIDEIFTFVPDYFTCEFDTQENSVWCEIQDLNIHFRMTFVKGEFILFTRNDTLVYNRDLNGMDYNEEITFIRSLDDKIWNKLSVDCGDNKIADLIKAGNFELAACLIKGSEKIIKDE